MKKTIKNKFRCAMFLISALGTLLLLTAEKSANRIEYTTSFLRDPFQASTDEMEKTDARGEISTLSLTLEGLLWASDRPQAIISGKIVEAGGRVGDAEVLEIGKKGVKMRYKGQEFWLRPREAKA